MVEFKIDQGVIVLLIKAGSVFPLPTCIITAIYAYGRVAHQKGESEAYGKQ